MNARVLEVSAESAGGLRYGTGFALSARLVLTARHVVADADRISVRALGDDTVRSCRRVWTGDRTDAALLEVTCGDLARDDVRLGGLAAFDEAVCRAVGFPRFQVDHGVGNDTEQVTGTIAPETGAVGGRWQMKVTGDVPPSRWEGLSGAAVFTAGVLIGLVTEALREFTPSRLRVEPLTRVTAEPGFADAWRRVTGSAPPALEAADLTSLVTTRDVVPHIGSPGALLRAEVGAVRFSGRESELGRLRQWCEGDGPRVHLVTGPAGAGKSRLALRLTAERRAAGEYAGTLRTPLPGTGLERLARLTRPVLCVVDYAETRQEELAALLSALRDRSEGASLRLLLLARTDRDWYERLRTEHGLLTPDPIRLGHHTDPAATHGTAFAEAAHDLAAAVRRLPEAWPIGDPALLRPPPNAQESPLALQAAALVGLLQTGGSAVCVPEGTSVWEVLLRHERLYWDRAARSRDLGVSPELRSELVVAATLCAPRLLAEARRLAADVLRAADPLEPRPRLVADWLRDLYPGADGTFWDGLRPDRLAEHAVMNTLVEEPDLLVRLLRNAPDRQADAALTLLSRAGAHRPESAPVLRRLLTELPRLASRAARTAAGSEHPAPLVRAVEHVVEQEGLTEEELWDLEEVIPARTVVLGDVAVKVTEALATICARSARAGTTDRDLAFVALLRHAQRLSGAGREAEALAAHTKVFASAKETAESEGSLSTDVVVAATGLAQAYSDVGHHDDALRVTRMLAELVTDETEDRDLAGRHVTMLLTFGARLAEAGQTSAALEVVDQAVSTARWLTGAPASDDLLGMALESRTRMLFIAGRPYEAVAAAQEAVTVRRAAAPAADRPDGQLGWCLRDLAQALGAIGAHTEELAALQESVLIHRELADDEHHRVGLPEALGELSRCLSRLGRPEEAVEAGAEQVALLRRLTSLAPERFEGDLGTALHEHAARLLDADRFTEARAASAEAERLRHEPPDACPPSPEPPPLPELPPSPPETEAPAMPESPLDAAVDQLTDLVTAQPDDAGLRLLIVQALVAAGRPGEALRHAQEALRADPSSAAAREAMSAALLPRLPAPGESPETPEAPETPVASGRPAPPEAPERVRPATPQPAEGHGRVCTDTDAPADEVVEVGRSTVKLADVAGMAEVKARLNTTFFAHLRNPEISRSYGQSVRGSLLLYGPPGCGKTYIAKAVAGELDVAFISVTLADTLDMWMGTSEKNIQSVFRTARRTSPCVLFLDEADAIGGKRSLNRHASGMRNVVTQLLTELDSIGSDNDGVFVLGASNHPWDIDDALLRPGRFDRTLFVAPPDAEAREAIIRAQLRTVPASDVDTRALACATENYSGADVTHLCRSAIEIAMQDALAQGRIRGVTTADFHTALRDVRPSVGPWFESAKNVVAFAKQDDRYRDLITYLGHRKRR
ncbi:AAA family ATPase [Streptomyces sp. NPDC029044]|uniref:AAA family ATPase n=1 Tax=Streptomyces sp. NPDC029044 TaxID=3157198 RepID=UPI0033DD2EBA